MKKHFLLFTIITSFTTLSFAQIPTNGLVGYWPFNGNEKDQSGNGNNGNVNGATLNSDRFGKDSSAYFFDGIDNYIKVNASNNLNIKGSYTISAWINPIDWGESAPQGYGRIVDKSKYRLYLNNPAYNVGGGIQYSDHSIVNSLQSSNNPTPSNSSGYSIALNVWQHVAVSVTLNGSNNRCDFYVNGNSVSTYNTAVLPTTFDDNISDDLYIGETITLDRAFKGKIDDIAIYNRALSPSEINQLYKQDMHVTVTDTIHKFDTIKYSTTDTLFINWNPVGFHPLTFEHTIKVFPNPTQDHVTLDFGNDYGTIANYKVKIINNASQTVYQTLIYKASETIDLKNLTGKGIYFVQLFDDKNNLIEIKKLVLL